MAPETESDALPVKPSAKLPAAKINLPAWSSFERLYTGGLSLSPGPMTLVSSLFSENDSETDNQFVSQLLSASAGSPVRVNASRLPVESRSGAGELRFPLSRPADPVASQPPAVFDIEIPPESITANLNSQILFPYSQIDFSSQLEFDCPLSGLEHYSSSLPQRSISYNSMEESMEISDYKPHSLNFSVDKPTDDGYNWRKYGQKQVRGSEFPRSYYKCTHSDCPVKKIVERSLEGHITEIIYKSRHNHSPPSKPTRDSEVSFEHHKENGSFLVLSHGFSNGDEADIRDQYEPKFKKRNVDSRTLVEPRVIVQTMSEIELLDDGYKWRKYGQKVVKGNPHPRSYYRCTASDCTVRKHVERMANNPGAVLTTYEGKHKHGVPASKTSNVLTEYRNSEMPSVGMIRFKEERVK